MYSMGFPLACGIEIFLDFSNYADKYAEDALKKELARFPGQCIIGTLNDHQPQSRKLLQKYGFTEVWHFRNQNSRNMCYIYILDNHVQKSKKTSKSSRFFPQ